MEGFLIAMVSAYVENYGDIAHARKVFDEMPGRGMWPLWNAMIIGVDKARRCLNGCVGMEDPFCSICVDEWAFEDGEIGDAVRVYEEMMVKNVVSWSTMVDGYMKASCFEDGFGQNGYGKEALELQMLRSNPQKGGFLRSEGEQMRRNWRRKCSKDSGGIKKGGRRLRSHVGCLDDNGCTVKAPARNMKDDELECG
ncbi:pentatricopeptide repeat-containing protein, mitochondrial [Artemisia annua]|uniref:Pentatricopeptide repeat-containing protein, mitochondrial n=1 Tax=Artemisia annua TaxID=35608 RepID=A0A2U1KHN8_ARTAN|nr:pentatricopeptide repeat-containing protein, mitochondrial [Artemisia annua]